MKNKVSVFSTNMGNEIHYGIEYSFDRAFDADTIMRLNRACDTYLFQSIDKKRCGFGPILEWFQKSYEGTYENAVQFSNPKLRRHRIIMRDVDPADVNRIAHTLARLLGTECNTIGFTLRKRLDVAK